MDGWYGVVGDWVGFTITINKNDHYLYRIAPYHVVAADIHLRYVCGVRVGGKGEGGGGRGGDMLVWYGHCTFTLWWIDFLEFSSCPALVVVVGDGGGGGRRRRRRRMICLLFFLKFHIGLTMCGFAVPP